MLCLGAIFEYERFSRDRDLPLSVWFSESGQS